MANISIETAAITGDTRGEDVRDAIVSADTFINIMSALSVETEGGLTDG